jgi:predicted SAM-dependent methyltransferase
MKLYIGSRKFRPDGFLTVDIDPKNQPDILADAAALTTVDSGTVDEIVAGHVLEHIPYPRSYQALAEWARVLKVGGVLKVGVPDLKLLCSMVLRGVNVQAAIGMIYGVDRIENVFEGHQYGYTLEMLVEMFTVLGFTDFKWWHSPLPDATNGWMHGDPEEQYAISLNVAGTKRSQPVVDVAKTLEVIHGNLTRAFMSNVRAAVGEGASIPEPHLDGLALQNMHYDLLVARRRITQLEGELETFRRMKSMREIYRALRDLLNTR